MKSLLKWSLALGCVASTQAISVAQERLPAPLPRSATVQVVPATPQAPAAPAQKMAPAPAIAAPQTAAPAIVAPQAAAPIVVSELGISSAPVLEIAQGDGVSHVMSQDGGLSIRGWLNAGYIYNTDDPRSKYNGPYNAVDRSNEGMFNQAYLIFEKLLPKDGCLGFGGRIDLMYGEDFLLAQSRGIENHDNGSLHWNDQYYGVAIPQAYVEAGSDKASLKVGHFYSIVGYEGVQAPGNFFYSHAYSYQFAGPFTHSGALATVKLGDNLQLQGGLHNGWDTFDGEQDHVSFLAGIKYTSDCKTCWSSFAITAGQEPQNLAGLHGIPDGYTNRTRYSFIVDVSPTDRLEYVFHHWLGWQEDGGLGGRSNAVWYGLDQYLLYKLCDKAKAGARLEWFKDEDGTRVGLNRPSNLTNPPLPGDYFSVSLGVNFAPCCNVMIRPELRYDWQTNNPRNAFNDRTKDNQFMLGIDAIVHF